MHETSLRLLLLRSLLLSSTQLAEQLPPAALQLLQSVHTHTHTHRLADTSCFPPDEHEVALQWQIDFCSGSCLAVLSAPMQLRVCLAVLKAMNTIVKWNTAGAGPYLLQSRCTASPKALCGQAESGD